ncbi:MAG: malate/lactate/ureidoglycolate dehydrogenase [Burkholderiaceae bacterium]
MTAAGQVRVPADGLARVIATIFERAGAGGAEAAAIAHHLVDANLAVHDSHGVVRVPRYLKAAADGDVHFGRTVTTVLDGGAFALLDGDHGFGQSLGRQALEIGVAKAREHGVALIALRKSGHLGRIGAWAEMACAQGLVSVHFVNVANSMLVAPFGGADRRMSTAPVTIGIPNPGSGDFILDFATSRVAEGKALIALKGGKPLPAGSLVDAAGQPSTNPADLYGPVAEGEVPNPRAGPGAITAMGEHKGSGLGLACELLAGALTGSGPTGPGGRVHNGMFSVYVSPQAIDDGHDHARSVRDYIDFVRACRPADPAAPVMIPGDPERRTRDDRLAHGVPLPIEPWENILGAGQRLGMARDALLASAGMG